MLALTRVSINTRIITFDVAQRRIENLLPVAARGAVIIQLNEAGNELSITFRAPYKLTTNVLADLLTGMAGINGLEIGQQQGDAGMCDEFAHVSHTSRIHSAVLSLSFWCERVQVG
jgi:hypothetical protein